MKWKPAPSARNTRNIANLVDSNAKLLCQAGEWLYNDWIKNELALTILGFQKTEIDILHFIFRNIKTEKPFLCQPYFWSSTTVDLETISPPPQSIRKLLQHFTKAIIFWWWCQCKSKGTSSSTTTLKYYPSHSSSPEIFCMNNLR